MPTTAAIKTRENVVFKTEPALEIASTTYKGNYDQLTAVNHAVASWVQDNGYEFDGIMFCIKIFLSLVFIEE